MPTMQDFKNAPDKAEFILSSKFDNNLYNQFANSTDISKEERQAIAKELISTREQYDFDALIIKLADLCFTCKGPEFIRGGSSDFLADILQELAQQTDAEQFIRESKAAKGESKVCAFPSEYKPSDTLSHVLSFIQFIAKKFTEDKNEPAYTSNLGQNLANKIFFPLLINCGTPQEGAALVMPFKVWAAKKSDEVGDYFSKLIPNEENSKVPEYYKNKDQNHDNAIQTIKNLIKNKRWELGGFGIFQGGLEIELDGEKVRVPHRVAAMAQLIQEYEKKPGTENVFKLYDNIREKAQEALDAPRRLQKESTKEFYRNVLNNLYVSDEVLGDTNDSDATGEQRRLIN